jgi:hypothetical protein
LDYLIEMYFHYLNNLMIDQELFQSDSNLFVYDIYTYHQEDINHHQVDEYVLLLDYKV